MPTPFEADECGCHRCTAEALVSSPLGLSPATMRSSAWPVDVTIDASEMARALAGIFLEARPDRVAQDQVEGRRYGVKLYGADAVLWPATIDDRRDDYGP